MTFVCNWKRRNTVCCRVATNLGHMEKSEGLKMIREILEKSGLSCSVMWKIFAILEKSIIWERSKMFHGFWYFFIKIISIFFEREIPNSGQGETKKMTLRTWSQEGLRSQKCGNSVSGNENFTVIWKLSWHQNFLQVTYTPWKKSMNLGNCRKNW